MAGSAFAVTGKGGEAGFGVELMAERAVGSEAGLGVDASFGIHVESMGKIVQNGAGAFVRGKRQEIGSAVARGGIVALAADLSIGLAAEGVSVAHHALLVAGTFERDRSGLLGNVAEAAIERASEHFFVEGVEQELLRPQRHGKKNEQSPHQYFQFTPSRNTCEFFRSGEKRKKSLSRL
jgi:hypothetical protein